MFFVLYRLQPLEDKFSSPQVGIIRRIIQSVFHTLTIGSSRIRRGDVFSVFGVSNYSARIAGAWSVRHRVGVILFSPCADGNGRRDVYGYGRSNPAVLYGEWLRSRRSIGERQVFYHWCLCLHFYVPNMRALPYDARITKQHVT